jgi:hypothetical protein
MTERKPAGMPTGSWIEAQILKAQQEGQFDGVGSAPDPLADIDEPYHPDWWVKKLIRREGLTIVPEMLALKREISEFIATLHSRAREDDVRDSVARLNARVAEVNLVNDSPVTCDLSPLDPAKVIDQWQRSRRASG